MISTLCIFYRPLGCNDEAATDEEQGEKILYYLPEDTPLGKQLSRLTMVEGLIEFSGRFSQSPLETVVMDKQTWAFLQCEQNLWVVASMNNQVYEDDNRRPNGVAFTDALTKMYRLYCLFRGNITDLIRGDNGKGMAKIRRVQEERKLCRKLTIKLKQDEADLSSLWRRGAEEEQEEGRDQIETLGIRSGASVEDASGQVQATQNLIQESKERLQRLLVPQVTTDSAGVRQDEMEVYTPDLVRRTLASFVRFYLSTNDIFCPSAIHSAAGIHFCPVGHPAFQSLLRVRQAAEDISRGILCGCMIIHDGGVAWTDFDDDTTFMLYEYLRLREMDYLRTSLLQFLDKRGEGRAGIGAGAEAPGRDKRGVNQGSSSPGDYSRQSHTAVEEDELARGEVDWARELKGRRGYITGVPKWGIVDLEEDVMEERLYYGPGVASPPPLFQISHQDSLFSDYCTAGGKFIWCPRVFACDSRGLRSGFPGNAHASSGNAPGGWVGEGDLALQCGQFHCIGRVIVYRQGAFLLTMLLPDWSTRDGGPPFAVDHIYKLLQSLSEAGGVGGGVGGGGGGRGSEEESTGILPSTLTPKRIGEGSLLHLCASLERGLAPELELLERLVATGGGSNSTTTGGGGAFTGITKKKQASLPDNVRLLYFNACNRALKSGTLFRRTVDPVLLWPSSLSKVTDAPRSSSLSLTLDSVRPRFPLPCSLLTDCVEPAVLRALNDIRETLSSRARECAGGDAGRGQVVVTEACLRVSTMHRGGVWCLGRRFGARFLFVIAEKCSTLNDAHEALATVTDEVFWQVVL